MNEPQAQKFDEWAVVELFGHQRIAGKVSEATIGGCAFVRVDVPQTAKPAYTKFFGNGAIYAMTPCDEAVARLAAVEIEKFNVPIRVHMPTATGQIPARVSDRDDDEFPDDDDNDDDWEDYDAEAAADDVERALENARERNELAERGAQST